MASPIDSARVATSSLTGTPYTINVGSPAKDILLIVLIRLAGAAGTLTFTGYTNLATDSSDATDDITAVYYRWADGTEGATDTLTSVTGAIKGCALCWEIEGAAYPPTRAPEISAVAVGTTTLNTANPNSRAVTGGPKDVLYLAMMGLDGEGNAPTASPTNYSTVTTANSGTAGLPATNCSVGGGSRQILNSSSDDPGVFTHPAATTGWTAYTVVIHPGPDMPSYTVGSRIGY